MTELDIGVIYLQNIQRNKHKYNTMSCPHVHSMRDTPRRHAAATKKNSSIQRPAGVATLVDRHDRHTPPASENASAG